MKKIIILLAFLSIAFYAFAQDVPDFVRDMRQKNSQTSFINSVKILESGKKGDYKMTVLCIGNKKYLFVNGSSTVVMPIGEECE